MSSIKNIAKFFGSKPTTRFIVAGASNNPSKFGYKVLKWYVSRDLPVTPINPKSAEILGVPVSKTFTSYLEQAGEDVTFSISVITPPAVSLQMVDEFANYKDKINGIWYQPGSSDRDVIEKLTETGLIDKVIHQGHCILVRGDAGLNEFYGKELKL